MKLCISEACTMPASFADDVSACAAAGCPALEVWLTKLEQHLETSTVDATKKLLNEKSVSLAAAAYQGGLLLSQGEARKAHFDHYRKRLHQCETFGIPTILIVADFQAQPQPTDLERAVVSLTQAAQWAAGFGVHLGIEFRAAQAFCTCLDTAVKLVTACGESNVGVCLDLFHYSVGPSKPDDLSLLDASNLAHVQLCDLSGVPRELASDADRILPGDGEFDIPSILQRLREIRYDRYVSLELMNPVIWQAPAHQVYELSFAALQQTIGDYRHSSINVATNAVQPV